MAKWPSGLPTWYRRSWRQDDERPTSDEEHSSSERDTGQAWRIRGEFVYLCLRSGCTA